MNDGAGRRGSVAHRDGRPRGDAVGDGEPHVLAVRRAGHDGHAGPRVGGQAHVERGRAAAGVLRRGGRDLGGRAAAAAPELERVVLRARDDAPPVRGDSNTKDLRRRQIITKVQWTPQRTCDEWPFSVATHLPVATSHTLSVLSCDPDTTRRPSGVMATQLTYDEDTSSQKYSGRRNARSPSALAASPGICRSPRPTP